MPKVVTKQTREEILKVYRETGNQSETARRLGVSFCFVHHLVNNKPIRRTAPRKNRCPITGF